MPICTVDRKRPGSAASASARLAPRRPSAASVLRRERRAETMASSDSANTPFKTTRDSTMATSSTEPRRPARAVSPVLSSVADSEGKQSCSGWSTSRGQVSDFRSRASGSCHLLTLLPETRNLTPETCFQAQRLPLQPRVHPPQALLLVAAFFDGRLVDGDLPVRAGAAGENGLHPLDLGQAVEGVRMRLQQVEQPAHGARRVDGGALPERVDQLGGEAEALHPPFVLLGEGAAGRIDAAVEAA